MNLRTLIVAVIVAGWIGMVVRAVRGDIVVIHDQTFASWQLVNLGGTNVSSMSASRLAGQGITGDARRVSVSGFGSLTYRAENFKTDRVWNPATDCIIQSVDWELWYRFSGAASTYAAIEIIARQGDSVYRAASSFREPQNSSPNWQRHVGAFAVTEFIKVRGTGPASLSFAADAAPIQFGYSNFSNVFIPAPAVHTASFFNLNLARVPHPAVAAATSLSICRGESGSMTVTTEGTGPFAYRWQRNGIDLIESERIAGTGTAQLTLLDADSSDAGLYQCVVSSPCGVTISSSTNVTICCRADVDGNGQLNGDDLGEFVNCYFSDPACSYADFNADGDRNGDDLAEYVNAFFAGCG